MFTSLLLLIPKVPALELVYKWGIKCYCQGSPLCLITLLLLFQLIDITGKDQDESMIALHDCNGDVNRAINVLLEGSPDTVSVGFV